MPTATMTGRERVNCAMTRQDHDRVPRHESFWSDTIRRWEGEGLVGGQSAVLNQLGSDFRGLGHWTPIFPGHREVIAEDEQTITFVNGWLETVKEWKGRSGTPEHLGWGCPTRKQWETTFKPALENMTHDDVDPDAVAKACAAGHDQGKWCFLATLETFEALRHLLGDVDSMMTMCEDPEWIREMSRVWTDAMIRRLERQTAAGIELDGVWCYGDMAFNHATMCSPAMYRELIWPDHKRMADWAHSRGAKFIFHTDGNVNGVMDLYVDAGFDCLQPLECKAGMDIRNLVPKYGDQLSFFGNVDIMAMATNDRDTVEAEVVAKLEAGKQKHGYIYHSDHSVPPSVSWQTYQFVIELIERHGQYT